MVQRRKFLIGMGALAAGTGAAMGTGAFTSASIKDRQVRANVVNDKNGMIALVPGADPDIFLKHGQLKLSLKGANGEGININSKYTWGDPNNPADDYAFKIVNNDDLAYNNVDFKYVLDDTSWIDTPGGGTYDHDLWDSYLKFSVFNIHGSYSDTDNRFPNYASPPYANPPAAQIGQGIYKPIIEPGDEWYVVVDVDTTGGQASTADDLSGLLTIDVNGPVSP